MTTDQQAFRRTFDLALNDFIAFLSEAQTYLGSGEDGAAIGTLIDLDERYADLQAAYRLFRNSRRRG